jgi:hypothetical protein
MPHDILAFLNVPYWQHDNTSIGILSGIILFIGIYGQQSKFSKNATCQIFQNAPYRQHGIAFIGILSRHFVCQHLKDDKVIVLKMTTTPYGKMNHHRSWLTFYLLKMPSKEKNEPLRHHDISSKDISFVII